MGICKLCGESAGLFKTEHEACKKKFQVAKKKIIQMIKLSIFNKSDLEVLDKKIDKIAKDSYISDGNKRSCLIQGWESAVAEVMEKGFFTECHEKFSDQFIDYFDLSHKELDKNGLIMEVLKSLIIHNLQRGKLETKITVDGISQKDLEEGEILLWVFFDVKYGFGVVNDYVSLNGKTVQVENPPDYQKDFVLFPKNLIRSKESVYVDQGSLVLTNKCLYYFGEVEDHKIRIEQIVSMTKYDDGIEIQMDSMVNSPLLYKTDEGWFTYELFKGLKELTSFVRKNFTKNSG